MAVQYKTLIYFFLALLVVVILGFYNSYFGHLNDFQKFPVIEHIHITAFLLWFVLLIIQPLLIRQKKYDLHRYLGYFAHLLVPILILTAVAMSRIGYEKEITLYSQAHCFTILFATYLDLFFLSLFYIIAVINSKNLSWHICFIIGTSIVIFGPGMSRVIQLILPWGALVTLCIVFIKDAIVVSFMLLESWKLKTNLIKSPYLILLSLFFLSQTAAFVIPKTTVWRWAALKIVGLY